MLKTFLAAAALACALAAPAFADDMMKCDDATMKMMHDNMDKMAKDAMAKPTDAMKQGMAMATKEMAMASDAMKANKMDECAKHLDMANKNMMMK
jgi:hypothetical protein